MDRFYKGFGDFSLPTFKITYDYILIELIKTNYDLYWCDQMIKLYETCWEKKYMKELIQH